jgi:hypothetical protein
LELPELELEGDLGRDILWEKLMFIDDFCPLVSEFSFFNGLFIIFELFWT